MFDLKVTEEEINVNHLIASQQSSKDGAQVLFVGKVRDLNQGKRVVAVSYQAHTKLAEKSFMDIANRTVKKIGEDLSITIHHRVGRLEVHGISIAILVSSPHRDAAYEASRFIIEEIKTHAPIWKKEHYFDGDSEWLQGHSLCGHARAESTSKTQEGQVF